MYTVISGHDITLDERKGFLHGYYQPNGVLNFTGEPCNTVVFGNAQILVAKENNSVKIRVKIYDAATENWTAKDIV